MTVLVLMLILLGCSGKPSDVEIESLFVENLLKDGGEQLFQIDNFEKTNGFEKDSKNYIADVKYDLVFVKSLSEISERLVLESKHNILNSLGAGIGLLSLKVQYGNFKAGHRITKEEKVTFIKTEKGWRISQ